MKFRKLLPFMVLLFGVLGLASCGSDTSDNKGTTTNGGTLSIVAAGDLQTMNPLFASDRVSMTVNNAIYSPLYYEESTGDLTYFLGESLTPSEDFLTYTLKLKKDLKWHDGTPLTADDVVFTMEKIMDESQNTFLRSLFMIDGKPIEVKKVDDLTVTFKLPAVSMAFVSSLGEVYPIAKHVYEGEKNLQTSEKNQTPIGSGPYKFKEYKHGESIVLVKNEDFFLGAPRLNTVAYRILTDPNSANVSLQNGEVQAKYITPNDVEKFDKDPNIDLVVYDEGKVENLIFFQKSGNSLKEKEVRQGIGYAINRDDVIKAAYQSDKYAKKAYSVLSPDTKFHTDDVTKLDYNPKQAQELLKKHGVDNLKLKLAYPNDSKALEAEALVIQANLKEVGIQLELMPMERSAFVGQLYSGSETSFDLALNGYVMGVEPDAYKSLFVTKEAYNSGGFSNPRIDELFALGAMEPDEKKREEIYVEIQKILSEDLCVFPLSNPMSIIAIQKTYKGIEEATPVPIFMFRDLSKLYVE